MHNECYVCIVKRNIINVYQDDLLMGNVINTIAKCMANATINFSSRCWTSGLISTSECPKPEIWPPETKYPNQSDKTWQHEPPKYCSQIWLHKPPDMTMWAPNLTAQMPNLSTQTSVSELEYQIWLLESVTKQTWLPEPHQPSLTAWTECSYLSV